MSSGELPIVRSESIICYVKGPGNVRTIDLGATIDLSIYTNNAHYLIECSVESATTQ
jgi:hypothetical protein